jgi:hypothetical protein
METDLLNTFNRLCQYLEKNNCSLVFLIEHDIIMFKLNHKIFPNHIYHSYNWFCTSTKTPDIQTQLNYFLLPLNNLFSSIFMNVQHFPQSLLSDVVSLISVFGIPKSLEEINMKLDLYGV